MSTSDTALEARVQALEAQLAHQERELKTLRRVALAANASLELEPLLETLVAAAVELTSASAAHVIWRDEAELDRLIASRSGDVPWRLPDDAIKRLDAVRHALAGQATGPGEPLVCLPLIAGTSVLGALCVAGPLPQDAAMADLQVLAAHAALALEHSVLFTALKRRGVELEKALDSYHTATHEAHTDPLTGIANRRQFEEQGRREAAGAKRYKRSYSVIMADIDHFKRFNDTYGHDAGDAVLVAVASGLARQARDADLVARWGGEEFVVLCPTTELADALKLAERLRGAIAKLNVLGPHAEELPKVTVSLGVATYHGDEEDPLDAVFERADQALYAAKQAGRNRVHPSP